MGDGAIHLARSDMRRRWGFLVALIAGLVLAGVPTYYTVFVERATKDSLWVRIGVFVVWGLVGAYVLWRAWARDTSIDQAMADRAALQKEVRTSATYDVLEALTRPGAMGLPPH